MQISNGYILTGNVKTLDFFEYTRKWVEKSNIKGKGNYSIMLNSLYRFLKSDTLSLPVPVYQASG